MLAITTQKSELVTKLKKPNSSDKLVSSKKHFAQCTNLAISINFPKQISQSNKKKKKKIKGLTGDVGKPRLSVMPIANHHRLKHLHL